MVVRINQRANSRINAVGTVLDVLGENMARAWRLKLPCAPTASRIPGRKR